MKNLTLVLAICFMASTAMVAQINTLLVGGSIGYDTDKTESGNTEVTSNTFSLLPRVGYQFNDNWTLGLVGGVASSTTDDDRTEIKTSATQIGAFGRYTHGLGSIFSLYGDLDAGYQSGKTEVNDNTTSEESGFFARLTPALFINFKNSFGLNFSIGGIGYSNLEDSDADIKTSSFDINFGRSFNLGISKNFDLSK